MRQAFQNSFKVFGINFFRQFSVSNHLQYIVGNLILNCFSLISDGLDGVFEKFGHDLKYRTIETGRQVAFSVRFYFICVE